MGATGNCSTPTSGSGGVKEWVLAIDECADSFQAGEEEKYWSKACIYRVPDFIREKKKKAFTPQVVSLGPFHNGAEALLPVEEHKRRALIAVLRRSRKPLSRFMEAVHGVARELQDCYHNLEEKWRGDVDRFAQLMVLDGCFVLETIRTGEYRASGKNQWNPPGTFYAKRDPVFSAYGYSQRLPYILRDMLVLENQIPLKLLKVLLEVEGLEKADDKLVNAMVLTFFNKKPEEVNIDGLALHPLDLYRKSMIDGDAEQDPTSRISSFTLIRPATELREAGITFKKADEPRSLSSIKFEHGVLHLPLLQVDDTTEFKLLNMIALEQIHVGCSNHITAYATFMDELIDTSKDVKLLEAQEIIKNAHGSSESVANMFNGLSTEVTMIPGWGLEKVREQVNKHCGEKCNKHMASLRHTYCQSPWASISLFGAILVILLTASQTAYTILQYHLAPKS